MVRDRIRRRLTPAVKNSRGLSTEGPFIFAWLALDDGDGLWLGHRDRGAGAVAVGIVVRVGLASLDSLSTYKNL